MRLSRLFGAALAAVVLGLASGPALAAPTAKEKAQAKQLVVEAQTASKQKRWADAEAALRRADELDPSGQTKVDLAKALTEQGKLVEASGTLHAVTDDASSAKTPQAKKSVLAAKKALGEIEKKIPWLQVTVTGPGPGKARTMIDGSTTDASTEVPLDPGDHVVSAEADGFERAEKKVKLAVGAHEKVQMALKKSAAPAEEPVAAAEEEPQPSSSGGSKVPAILAFGVGAVGLGIGAVFGVMAFNEESKASDSKAEFEKTGSKDAKDNFENSLSTSKTNGTVSTVGFIVGGVGVGAGVILLLVSGSSSDASKPEGDANKVSVRPWIGPGQAGLVGSF